MTIQTTQLFDSNYIFLKRPEKKIKMLPESSIVFEQKLVSLDRLSYLCSLVHEVMHFDVETTGLEPTDPLQEVVSLSWATSKMCVVFDVRDWTDAHWHIFLECLIKNQGIAYNSVFDFSWAYAYALRSALPNPLRVLDLALYGCSLTLFRQVANERWWGQRYTLADAQAFMGIEEGGKNWLKDALETHKLKKHEMYKLLDLDHHNFLRYNAEDSDLSYLFWKEVCGQLVEAGYENVLKFHLNEQVVQIREMILQEHEGMPVDREELRRFLKAQEDALKKAEHEFRNHPKVKDYVKEWERAEAEAFFKPTITTKKEWAKFKDEPWNNQHLWKRDLERKPKAKWQETHGSWYKEIKTVKPRNEGKEAPKYNIGGKDTRNLFYNHLYSYRLLMEGKRMMVEVDLEDRKVKLRLTKGARNLTSLDEVEMTHLPLDSDTYTIFGDLGKILKRYATAQKLIGYANKALAKSYNEESRIHLKFIPYGTMTGRVNGSGGFSFVQQPKVKEYMECFRAPEGYVFYEYDLAAAEPTVMTQFSRDESLMELYASGKTHDIYLYHACNIHPNPKFREELKSQYKPEPDVIAHLKKKYKTERSFIKVPVLSLGYGLYPYSLYIDWQAQGYNVTEQECWDVFNNYWASLGGVKEWEQKLLAERDRRGGYIHNGFGHPICITDEKTAAIVNTFCQNTAHAVLMVINYHFYQTIRKLGVKTERPMVQDFHDERIGLVREDEQGAVLEAAATAVRLTNEELNADIPFKIDPCVGKTIWTFKE